MNKIFSGGVLGAMFLWGGLGIATAQEGAATTPPPKVMQIIREFVKPGKAGAAHEKGESAFVQAFARAKWPTHYFAATSVTRKTARTVLRCLRFVRGLGEGQPGDPEECGAVGGAGSCFGERWRVAE